MKKGLLLAVLVGLSVVGRAENFTQEQVLEVFKQYNPTVIEKAKTNALYESLLENFVTNYKGENNIENKAELIAVARNFENSIRLNVLTQVYVDKNQAAQASGLDFSATKDLFRQDLFGIMQNVWAVTVKVHEFQLDSYEDSYKQVKKDEKLDASTKEKTLSSLQQKIKGEKLNLKSLHKNVGEQVQSAVDTYVDNVNTSLTK